MFIEKDCTFELEGRTFESGGAVVTENYVIGYMSSDMKRIQTWRREHITDNVKITSSWRVRSFISDKQYQIRALINGRWFTGRTAGGGMIIRLKACKL